jgi:hypothetical protein
VARFLEENLGIEDMYELLLVSWLTAADEAPPPPQRAGRATDRLLTADSGHALE